MKFFQFQLMLCLIFLKDLRMSRSITVKFLNKEPLYIAPGKNLLLEAQFQLQQSENIILRTWERENSDGEVRVAEGDKTIDNRTHVENNGARLRINGVIDSDYGIYKITVTAINGDQVSDSRKVIKIENPPQAYLSMKCSVRSEGAKWDSTEYSWQVNGVKITNQTGEMSADGSELSLNGVLQNYTCTTSSSQGTSKVDVHIREPEQHPCSCVGWIVFAIIELVLLAGLTGLYCYKKKKSKTNSTI